MPPIRTNPNCCCSCHLSPQHQVAKVYEMAMLNYKYLKCNSEKVKIETPRDLFDQLNKEYHFTFDPCPIDYDPDCNTVPDGLQCSWGERNWVNPPFNQIKLWFQKAVEEAKLGKLTVMLCPFRPNMKYWWEVIKPQEPELYIIKGKVRFPNYKQGFPGPMCVMVIKPKAYF
jgi:hypothetical protein